MFYSPFNLKESSLMLYSPFNLKRSSIMFYSPFNLKTRQINIYQVSESKHGSGCSGEKDKHRTSSTHVYRDTGVYEENCMGQGLQRVPYRYYMYIVHPYIYTLLGCLFVRLYPTHVKLAEPNRWGPNLCGTSHDPRKGGYSESQTVV